MEKKESRKDVCDDLNVSPCHLASIGNKGQQPILQIFYELVAHHSVSADKFFPNNDTEKNTQRRPLDPLLGNMRNDGLEIVTATAQKVVEAEKQSRMLPIG